MADIYKERGSTMPSVKSSVFESFEPTQTFWIHAQFNRQRLLFRSQDFKHQQRTTVAGGSFSTSHTSWVYYCHGIVNSYNTTSFDSVWIHPRVLTGFPAHLRFTSFRRNCPRCSVMNFDLWDFQFSSSRTSTFDAEMLYREDAPWLYLWSFGSTMFEKMWPAHRIKTSARIIAL